MDKPDRKTELLASLGANTLSRENLTRQLQAIEQQANGIKMELFALEKVEKPLQEVVKKEPLEICSTCTLFDPNETCDHIRRVPLPRGAVMCSCDDFKAHR